MAINFPASLDALANPDETTYADDTGFELDEVIARLNDIAEALEAKVGLGATLPARGKALIGAGSGSIWDTSSRRKLTLSSGMQVWQEGPSASYTADNGYTSGNWRLLAETTGTGCTVTRETSDVPAGGSRYAWKGTGGSSNNTKFGLFQAIESVDCWHCRGQKVSARISLKVSDARIGDVRIGICQFTGTADAVTGDPVSAWESAGTNPTLAANWAYANTPANISPTTSWADYFVEDIAISASMTNLAVFAWVDDKTWTAGDYILITDFELERGLVCTACERRTFREELADDQRYMWKSFPYTTAPAQNAGSTGSGNCTIATNGNLGVWSVVWPVVMRATPTVTTYNTSAANANWSDGGTAGALDTSDRGVNIQASGSTLVGRPGIHVVARIRI